MRLMREVPGAVGISYRNADRLLDNLELLDTEVHGLVIARHGKVAIEGYWAPYGPGQVHGCQSLSKTVTGIALGAAIREGILSLDDRLIDIFPEYRPLTEGKKYWDELKVRHIATMSAGMDTQPCVMDHDWIREFFETPIVHKPGTAYFYHSIGISMVGACIREKTGLGLIDYLKPRVFDKIGIHAESLKWHCHEDGMENGSGGFVATAYDNALLMELYRRHGAWDGEQLLDPEWVDFALKAENPNVGGEALYGGMIWVRKRCFVADGAMGQWGMLFPKEDLVISITQTISKPGADNGIRDAVYRFADDLQPEPVKWTEEETKSFENRIRRLCIPRPSYSEAPHDRFPIDGKTLKITSGQAQFYANDLNIFQRRFEIKVNDIGFEERDGNLVLTVTTPYGTQNCPVSLKGSRPVYTVREITPNPAVTASVTGRWISRDSLELEVRWLESCRVHVVRFTFDQKGAKICTHRVPVGGFDVPDLQAEAVWA